LREEIVRDLVRMPDEVRASQTRAREPVETREEKMRRTTWASS
jgi:predicted RNA-binding protein YlqC (UPF0109 family)